jgi:hypothetical protein
MINPKSITQIMNRKITNQRNVIVHLAYKIGYVRRNIRLSQKSHENINIKYNVTPISTLMCTHIETQCDTP